MMRKKAVLFDAGLTLVNIYEKGKSEMFSYFCNLALDDKTYAKLDLLQGAKRAELHFQISHNNREYQKSDSFWIDNYAEGLIGAGLPKSEAYLWSPIIDKKVAEISKTYSLIDGVEDVLSTLKSHGYCLAIVSNWEKQSLKRDMDCLRISHYFDYIADSSVEGFSKPDPAIFKIVLAKLGFNPTEAIHIGDLYYSDIIGAQSAGIDAILYDECDALGDQFDCRRILKITDILGIEGLKYE